MQLFYWFNSICEKNSQKFAKCLLRHQLALLGKIQGLWETPICTLEEWQMLATMLATVNAIIWTMKGQGKSTEFFSWSSFLQILATIDFLAQIQCQILPDVVFHLVET